MLNFVNLHANIINFLALNPETNKIYSDTYDSILTRVLCDWLRIKQLYVKRGVGIRGSKKNRTGASQTKPKLIGTKPNYLWFISIGKILEPN